MPLLQVIIALIILGVVVYLVRLIPMDETIKNIIQVLIIVAIIIYLLTLLLGGGIANFRIL